jgi:pilus assembly protein FimV
MGENMNRLRAGVILKVPDEAETQAVDRGEARSVIQAQSADFDAYRSRLAANVAKAPDSGPRQAGGKVEAKVEDRKQAATPSPDQLKLSQGAVQPTAPEAQISRDAAAKDASTRVAELSRNIEELKQVKGAASAGKDAPKTAAAPAAPAAQPGVPVPVPAPGALPTVPPPVAAPVAAVPAQPPVPAASAPEPAAPVVAATDAASAAPQAASAPTVVAAPAPAPAPVPAAAEPAAADGRGMLDQILESPYLLPGGAVLAALLAVLGIYRVRARKKQAATETSFMESRLQPDSFFGASGGQRVDTNDSAAASPSGAPSSSMNYSLSQLDAIGDVDPVAEADVYLAYGRDLQAEEILKEAMRTDPNRLAVRTKLLEVYAKRRDVKGFELLATQLFTLTRGEGPDWQRAQELGRSIDPDNSLYTSAGRPGALSDDEPFSEPLGASTLPHSAMPSAPAFRDSALRPDSGAAGAAVTDLDIDLSGDAQPDRRQAAAAPARQPDAGVAAAGAASAAVAAELVDIDLDLGAGPAAGRAAKAAEPGRRDDGALDFDLSDISLELEPPRRGAEVDLGSTASDARPAGFIDLSNLPDDPDSQFTDDGDPLERKLDLADEFRQIGDLEGARDLLNEVIAGSDGALRHKAQTMLDSLG